MVPFIRFPEKVHGPPDDTERLRLQMGHKIFMGIPFFKKKEPIFIVDTLAAIAAPASLLLPDRTGE
jgi:uncharacterized membrane protein